MAEQLQLFLVEDHDDVGFVMRRCLERAGHTVTPCRTGADALIVLGHSQFHLVILDYYLEDMSGLDLLHHIQHEGITTPVLMITGQGDEVLATQVLRAGALDYVVKDPGGAYLAELPKRVRESVLRHRLQQANQLLIAALESTRDGVVLTDLQGVVQHVNGALEQMFGYARDELLGQDVRAFLGDWQHAPLHDAIWRQLLDRRSWQGEEAARRKDGSTIEVSLTISPIFDARGQMTHFVGILRDISERKLMEKQLFQAQKMHSVGTLAGGVAHEFNNLLAGIQGYASLALRDLPASSECREFLDHILSLSDRAANLTRQLLAFARKPALTRQPTSLTKLLESTRDFLQRSLNIEVVLDLQAEGEALADANQLQQVLVNLGINARDAMAAKTLSPVRFRLGSAVLANEKPAFPQPIPAGDYLVIEVKDRGCGMPPDVLAQAFDPFFTTKEIGKGTGLGLPVAFGIMTGHQGYMTLHSVVNEGTTVGLYLPRLSTRNSNAAAPAPTQLEPEVVGGRRILVIDDERSVLEVMTRFLQIAGHQVVAVLNGRDALAQLKQSEKFDLAIMDLMIPGEHGDATFRALRSVDPQLPVLLCTGMVQEQAATDLVAEGVQGILRKPFKMNELWFAVSRCLS